jgi:hypothetical protein
MIQEIVLEISLLVFMASFISSPRLRNAQSYKLLGFLGDFASQGLIIMCVCVYMYEKKEVFHTRCE